jgi:hypothetical protein
MMRGEGHTRDISASGVFVVASDPVPSGSVLSLQIVLPSLRAQRTSGASLCTLGHVVRSEPLGFAVVADSKFQVQFPEIPSSRNTRGKSGDSNHDTTTGAVKGIQNDQVLRFLA